jgi:parallel beta-helix repeat protein
MKGMSMKYLFRPLSTCLLAILLAVLVAGVASAQQEESTPPETTAPETTAPETTAPETTAAESTAPVSPQQQSPQLGGLVVRPGDSIQEAVNAADPGDTIVMFPGDYEEHVVIRKNGIALRGIDATLTPPAEPPPDLPELCQGSGICVLGRGINFQTREASRYVNNVSVSGLTVQNFEFTGIIAWGARGAKFTNNRAVDNAEYGITAFVSTGTQIISNVTSGSADAGIYVGDSQRANATVAGNETFDNLLGVLVRNALGGRIVGNDIHSNCVGVLILGGAPGSAGRFDVSTNTVSDNTRACPATEEIPAFSGIGIGLFGATGVEVSGNEISGNVASGPTVFEGGVVVVTSGERPPTNNFVLGNVLRDNEPDLFWDETGSGNRFVDNDCETSEPPDLCQS